MTAMPVVGNPSNGRPTMPEVHWPDPDLTVGPPTQAEKYRHYIVRRSWPMWCIALAHVLVAREVLERFESSSSFMDAAAIVVLLVPSFLLAVVFAVSRSRADLEGHVVFVERWRRGRAQLPSVDVFVTWSDEPEEALAATASSVRELEWPGQVIPRLLDLKGDPYRDDVARALGWAPHRAGSNRRGADHAFVSRTAASSDADVVLHLRPGSVMRPDALWELVPYLQEAGAGVVQGTAQAARAGGRGPLSAFAAGMQHVFDRWMQPFRDRRGRARVAASVVAYRRELLTAVPARTTRALQAGARWDAHLHAQGGATRHLPVVLSTELRSVSGSGSVIQQYRSARECFASLLHRPARRGRRAVNRLQALCFLLLAVGPVLIASPVVLAVWVLPRAAVEGFLVVTVLAAALMVLGAAALVERGSRAYVGGLLLVSQAHLAALVDSIAHSIVTVGGRYGSRMQDPRLVHLRVLLLAALNVGIGQAVAAVSLAHLIAERVSATSVACAAGLMLFGLLLGVPAAIEDALRLRPGVRPAAEGMRSDLRAAA